LTLRCTDTQDLEQGRSGRAISSTMKHDLEDTYYGHSGKVVIITGSSGGIGQMTARRFAHAGAKLVLVARSADKLKTLAEELRGQGRDAWL